MNIIKHILNLPNSAVFGIINHSTKEAFISHSKELKSRIGAIIESLPESLHNGELVIFSSIGDDEYKLLHAQNVINSLKKSGYVIFNSKEYINYKPKIIADPYTKTVFVMLVNKRNKKTLVGAFNHVWEAEEFIDQYYSNNMLPVYAINELTKKWVFI